MTRITCPHCGNSVEISVETPFCSVCGKRIIVEAEKPAVLRPSRRKKTPELKRVKLMRPRLMIGVLLLVIGLLVVANGYARWTEKKVLTTSHGLYYYSLVQEHTPDWVQVDVGGAIAFLGLGIIVWLRGKGGMKMPLPALASLEYFTSKLGWDSHSLPLSQCI